MKYLVILILSLFSLLFISTTGNLFFVLSITLTLITLLVTENKNLVHQLLGIGYVTFVAYPYVILFYLGWQEETLYLFYMVHFYFFFFFIYFTKENDFSKEKIIRENVRLKKIKYYFLCLSLIGMLFLTNGDPTFFVAGAAIILLFMLRYMNNFGYKDLFIYSIPYLGYIIIYSIFFWSGFGRLVLVGNIIFPLLYWLKFSRFKIGNSIIFIFSIIIGSLMSLLRFENESLTLDLLLKDSAVGPFILSYGMFSAKDYYQIDLSGLSEQIQLMFFAFTPRALWTDKPIGFGRLYVDKEMDTTIFSDSHSIAALIFGDYYFFLSKYWLIGIILFSVFIILFYRFLNHKLVSINHVALIYLPTLIWGGMASFGARFSTGAMAILILLFIEKCLFKYIKGKK
ncbi:hypothetical protein [Pasteurella multocida]|uniref:hypothetical protein n=1 Tax=Pasteurella multocida TaxID=747 RepID=UPI0029A918A8|nr:hypothetical protein [Pasteurella multocida]MDX3897797.1 hypothetical protein [Pasteurella multocida]